MQYLSSDGEPEQLGIGATVLSSVFALVVGLVVGTITTFTHGQFLPWGLVAGLLVVAALALGFRLVFDSRVIGAAAPLGVVVSSGILTLPGAGGSVLVLNDPAGLTWAIGPAVLSAVALAWPRPRPRSGPRSGPRVGHAPPRDPLTGAVVDAE